MRSIRVVLALAVLMVFAGLAKADGINPPDGNIGMQNGSQSVSVTTLVNFPFSFVVCATATGANATECSALGEPQAFFDGKNDTGMPWTSLQLDLTFSQVADAAPFSIACDGNPFFSSNNCGTYNNVDISSSSQTVDLVFTKGTGTGIGCYDTGDGGAELACALNSLGGSFANPQGLFDNPFVTSCPDNPVEVCGGYDFIIEIGYDNSESNPTFFPDVPSGSLSADIATPEPSALILFGTGLLGLAGFARKKLLKS